MRELGFGLLETIPFTRLRMRAEGWTSDRALGSTLDYRRVHVTLGGDVSLGRHWGFVPQLDYGRLYGMPVPQAAFALGGHMCLGHFIARAQIAESAQNAAAAPQLGALRARTQLADLEAIAELEALRDER